MKRQTKRQIINTKDGSNSIYLADMDEHYHSTHGAIAESEHIFIQQGLLAGNTKGKITVFEVGMGTGLNVLKSLLATKKHQLQLEMHTIEAYPVELDEISALNYVDQLGASEIDFLQIHQSPWNEPIYFDEYFSLFKYQEKVENYLEKATNVEFDVVYFDAFAPEKQPEMWTEAIFNGLYQRMNSNGILVTYCVKGSVRRMLTQVGFEVEKLPGPIGGKREMCRAWKR